MQKQDFNKEMEKIALENKGKKLLLHACCAPCASACIERIKDFFDVTVYFYNPNIDGVEEYALRSAELKRLCEYFNVPCVIENYNPEEYLFAVSGLEKEPEGGSRCEKCFFLRLGKSAEYAAKNGFDYFTTTLTVSPLKNAKKLNEVGDACAKTNSVELLPSDFKKKNGYLRSIELSKELALYRQNYCGCAFSKTVAGDVNTD